MNDDLKGDFSTDAPPDKPHRLEKLLDPNTDDGFGVEFEMTTKSTLDGVVSDALETPIDGKMRRLGGTGGDGEGNVVEDSADEIGSMIEGGSVEVCDVHDRVR